jgi:hypothetical protein
MSTLDDIIRDGIEACEFRDVGSSYATELVIQGSLNWIHRWLNPNDEQAAAGVDVVIAVAHPRRPRSPRVDRIDQSVGDASERNSDRRCVQVTPRNVEFLPERLTHRRNPTHSRGIQRTISVQAGVCLRRPNSRPQSQPK